MQSNDLVIRAERSVIDVVLKLEQDIAALNSKMDAGFEAAKNDRQAIREEMRLGFEAAKNDRQAIREEMGRQYVILTSNQGVLSGKLDNQKDTLSFMQNIFTWGFAAITIGIAVMPMLKEYLIYRQEKHSDEELERKIRKILSEMKDS